jgi:hypothetical protein
MKTKTPITTEIKELAKKNTSLRQIRENPVQKLSMAQLYKFFNFEALGQLYREAIRRQNIGIRKRKTKRKR